MSENNQESGKDGIDESVELPETQRIGTVLDRSTDKVPVSPLGNNGAKSSAKDRHGSEMEMMMERFAKLLLGEDMSGGGKGVSSALALSNAITNLAASVFGEQSKLEPMSPERKARWKKEIGWLLSVADYVVEFVPSQQKAKDGSTMEIMVTQQRKDLLLNIPALRKLDAMLLGTLDNFTNSQREFWYVSKDAEESEKGSQRNEKWWLPTVKVPPNGLSEESRQFLQKQKESVNQVLKASMAINAHILSDMDIPESYIESLPKNGKSSLGESIYRGITVEFFDPQQFLSTMDLSSEHKVLGLKDRIEASIVIWKRKLHHKDGGKAAWGLAISPEKRELFEERAQTILLLLKHQFPGLPQSSLDISKIQFNKDVGLSILESYSRVLESLANTVMSRIEDVLYADALAQDPSLAAPKTEQSGGIYDSMLSPTTILSSPIVGGGGDEAAGERLSSASETPSSLTLSDFMGWNLEPAEGELKKKGSSGNLENKEDSEEKGGSTKSSNSSAMIKKYLYIDKIEISGLRCPTPRH
ncbi:hypothetical protein ABFX02_11G048600 [Erythranthe guttata]